jgi:hypothetical protein
MAYIPRYGKWISPLLLIQLQMLVEILKSCGNLTHMCTAKKYIVSWLNHHLTISPSWHQLYHDYIPSF